MADEYAHGETHPFAPHPPAGRLDGGAEPAGTGGRAAGGSGDKPREPDEPDLTAMTAGALREWMGDDQGRALAVLDAERARGNQARSTVIGAAEAIVARK
jgi:hypothetical protein